MKGSVQHSIQTESSAQSLVFWIGPMVPGSCSDWVQAVQECRVQRVEVSVCTLQTHTLRWVVSVAQLDKAQHCHAQNGRLARQGGWTQALFFLFRPESTSVPMTKRRHQRFQISATSERRGAEVDFNNKISGRFVFLPRSHTGI